MLACNVETEFESDFGMTLNSMSNIVDIEMDTQLSEIDDIYLVKSIFLISNPSIFNCKNVSLFIYMDFSSI